MAQNIALNIEITLVRLAQLLERAERLDQVRDAFQSFIENVGFTSFSCKRIGYFPPITSDYVLLSTTPEGWMEEYLARGYARFDPILQEAQRRRSAFAWSEVYDQPTLTTHQREVLGGRTAHNMSDGLSIPIVNLHGCVGTVNIVGSTEALDEIGWSAMAMASVFLYQKLISLRPAATAPVADKSLSPREIEILSWITEGKSDWQIGQILSISEKTVNYHIENVKRKFGVATRVQAVVGAMRQGMLQQ